jgi:hypothetical protein
VSWETCVKTLIKDLRLTLSNLRHRHTFELLQQEALIAKTQRTDVLENPELLDDLDRSALADLDKKINRLRVNEFRIDRMLMILKDFI